MLNMSQNGDVYKYVCKNVRPFSPSTVCRKTFIHKFEMSMDGKGKVKDWLARRKNNE